jgi:hypothetical protein
MHSNDKCLKRFKRNEDMVTDIEFKGLFCFKLLCVVSLFATAFIQSKRQNNKAVTSLGNSLASLMNGTQD